MTKLLVLDVDGTLNDGTITYDTQGNELKSFSVKDGLAIVAWLKLGGDIAIITGRESPITDKRACELGITLVFQGVQNKGDVLLQIVQQKNYSLDEIAVIGDDVNDIHM
ncbi:MAG: HAD hydrolase family protein, partial [Helicobacter sp.]|nr:HAD hydrolase family protein [Helicobacter sp.]